MAEPRERVEEGERNERLRGLEDENRRLRDRARAGDRAREELAQRNERLALLSRLTKELASLDLDRICAAATTSAPIIFGARYASIYVVEEPGGRLVLRAHTHGRPIDRVVDIAKEAASVMARVVAGARPRVFGDLDAPAQDAPAPGTPTQRPHRELYQTRSCLIAPLRAGDEVLGVLNLADRADGRSFSEDVDLPIAEQIADLIALALRNVRLFERAKREARTDALTRLANHQAFHEAVEREVERATRYGGRFAVVLVDVDRFKVINDNDGSLAGDFVLEEVARALQASIRAVDTAARHGSDEFALLLPETELPGALALADRIRARCAQQRFRFGERELPVRLSLGAATHVKGERASEVVKAAWDALERARKAGGDRAAARD